MTLVAALRGVEAVISAVGGRAPWGRRGFPYSLSIGPYPWKARAEAHLRASGLRYTILGPGGLNDEPAGRKAMRMTGRTFALVNDPGLEPDAWMASIGRVPADLPVQ